MAHAREVEPSPEGVALRVVCPACDAELELTHEAIAEEMMSNLLRRLELFALAHPNARLVVR